MTAVAVPALSLSPPPFASSESATCSDYEYHSDCEIADLHDLVEGWHLALEDIDEERDREARNEWCEEGPEVPSVKKASWRLSFAVAGTGLSHFCARFSSASPVNRNTVQSARGLAPMRL